MSITCPLECIPTPSWLAEHETVVMALLGGVSALIGVLLNTCLRSRCTRLQMCCFSCDRLPVTLTATDMEPPPVTRQPATTDV